MLKLKSQKGAITLFVLLGMLFFIIVVVSLLFRTTNNNITQEADIRAIENQYSVNNEELNEIYKEL